MCHSKREAGCTYDRPSSVERKRQALSFVHHQINRFENDEEREDDEEHLYPKLQPPLSSDSLWEVCAPARPKILLGRVLF